MEKRVIDAKVRRVGNSFVITIPVKLAERLNLKVGDFLEVIIKKPTI